MKNKKDSKITGLLILRRFTQVLIIFLLFLTPVLGFVRFDKKNDSIWLLHHEIFLNSVSVYEVTLFLSLLVISGYLIYLLFGRVWCGFFCPQLTVYEFRDYVINKIKKAFKTKIKSGFFEKTAVYLFIGILSIALTYSVSSYFINFNNFSSFNFENLLYPLLVVFPLFIIDLTVLRPKMCDYCLYGYTQSSLSDENSIGISYKPSRTACKTCSDCKDICPQGFDPRNTHFRTCFNCAKCVDACPEKFIKFGFRGENDRLSFLNYKAGFLVIIMAALGFLMYLAPFRVGKIRFTAANYNLYHYWSYDSPKLKGYFLNKFIINATNFTNEKITVKPEINNLVFSKHQFLEGEKPFAVLDPHGKERLIFYVGVKKGALSPGVHDFKLSLISPKNGKPFETNTVSIYIPSRV
ncbi:MAG: 4Fe-4S binding protein [bacterium]